MMFALIALAVASSMYAQEPCPGRCDPQIPWIPATYQINLSVDCIVTIQYEWRACGHHELRVTGAQIIGPCAGLVDPISQALGIMVRANQMMFPTGAGQPQEQEHIWVISRPACWYKLTGGGQYAPCSDACCETTILVRNKANCNDYRIAQVTTTKPKRACPLSEEYLQEGGSLGECGPACNEVIEVTQQPNN